jgi:hypothetical protein
VLHQRYPAKVPQYVEHDLAKAAPTSSKDSIAASKIFLIVASYGGCHYAKDATQVTSE